MKLGDSYSARSLGCELVSLDRFGTESLAWSTKILSMTGRRKQGRSRCGHPVGVPFAPFESPPRGEGVRYRYAPHAGRATHLTQKPVKDSKIDWRVDWRVWAYRQTPARAPVIDERGQLCRQGLSRTVIYEMNQKRLELMPASSPSRSRMRLPSTLILL
jgi:hypothetical protein